MDLDLTGAGKDWNAIQNALKGKGKTEVVNGALVDVNLAESAQVRSRVSPITKAGLRSHLTCQENFRAQSRSRTSPTLPKPWEREPSSAVWKGSYRKNLPKEVPKRLPHKNKNHQTLRKKRNKVPKTKSSRDSKNRSGSKHDAVLFGISPFWEKESRVNLDRSHTPPNPSS